MGRRFELHNGADHGEAIEAETGSEEDAAPAQMLVVRRAGLGAWAVRGVGAVFAVWWFG